MFKVTSCLVMLTVLLSTEVCADDTRIPLAGGAGQLKSQLEPLGWRVEISENGNVELQPPGNDAEKTLPPESASRAVVESSTDLAQLQTMLRRTGWEVQRIADGSLILHPLAATEGETGATGIHKERMRDLYVLLKASGWSAVEASDGSLLLQSGASSAGTIETLRIPSKDLVGLAKALEQTGWDVARDEAGGFTAVPKAESLSKEEPTLAEPAAPVEVVSDIPSETVLDPRSISSEDEAMVRVGEWLTAQGRTDVQAGRTRRVNWVYVVSLVDLEPPYGLQDQVVVRANDGKVVPLF